MTKPDCPNQTDPEAWNSPHWHNCRNGGVPLSCNKDQNISNQFNIVKCGDQGYGQANIQAKIMNAFQDLDTEHYWGWAWEFKYEIKTLNSVTVPVLTSDTEGLDGKFCIKFSYNRLTGCNGDDPNTQSAHCAPWKKEFNSCWEFYAYHRIIGLAIYDAHTVADILYTLKPLNCKMIYKRPKITKRVQRCNLQRTLFEKVTKRIWHENLSYNLKEILNGQLQHDTAGETSGNLSAINSGLENFYTKYKNERALAGNRIPHCLKNTIKHTSMDFYCLTASGEKHDFDLNNQAGMDQVIWKAMLDEWKSTVGNENMRIELNTKGDGYIIVSDNTTIDMNGDVIFTNNQNVFANPDERLKGVNDDFVAVDQPVVP